MFLKLEDEDKTLLLTLGAILALILLAAFFSPVYSDKISYLQMFFMAVGIIFVVAVLTVFALLGFQSFAFYMAVFLGAVLLLEGLTGAIIVITLTYLAWGFVFALQALLAVNGVKSAIGWFKRRYDFRSFHIEYRFFYPMIGLMYLLLEWVPSRFTKEPIIPFEPKRLLEMMRKHLC